MLPNSVTPARITEMTMSATNSAATTPASHKGSVNVPVEGSSPGSQSKLIRASPPHQSGHSMAQRGAARQPKSWPAKDLAAGKRLAGTTLSPPPFHSGTEGLPGYRPAGAEDLISSP